MGYIPHSFSSEKCRTLGFAILLLSGFFDSYQKTFPENYHHQKEDKAIIGTRPLVGPKQNIRRSIKKEWLS